MLCKKCTSARKCPKLGAGPKSLNQNPAYLFDVFTHTHILVYTTTTKVDQLMFLLTSYLPYGYIMSEG